MVAGTCKLLGVHMGESADMKGWDNHLEDLSLVEGLGGSLMAIEKQVALRNKSHDLWGVKHPDLIKRVERLENLLLAVRNPHIIVIFRDPIAISRNRVAITESFRRFMQEAIGVSNDQINFLKWLTSREASFKVKPLILSYEKCLSDAEGYINTVAGHLNIQATEAQFQACLSYVKPSPGYQPIEEFLNASRSGAVLTD